MKSNRWSLIGKRFRLSHSWPFFIIFVTVLSCVCVVALCVWHYRFHLMWLYTEHRLGLSDVQSIPDLPMPDCPTPDGWRQCRVGCIEFSLPAELATNRVSQEEGINAITFQYGSRKVSVIQPTDLNELSKQLVQVSSRLCPSSQRFTVPKLRYTCYQSRADKFSWSLTPDEVRWFVFLMNTGNIMRLNNEERTQSLFRKDYDGIVIFYKGNNRVYFEWQSKNSPLEGSILFWGNVENAELCWIQSVCQSLKIAHDENASRMQ